MAKVVILKGSPKKGGNTDIMADALAEAARSAGHKVTEIPVGRMRIGGCRGCGACYTMGKPCTFDDEWNGIAPYILAADVLVVASPVYWFDLTSQVKAAIDRMFCFLRKGEEFRGKKAVLIMSAADGDDVFDAPKLVFERTAALNGWEVIGEVCAGNCGAHGDVKATEYVGRAATLAAMI